MSAKREDRISQRVRGGRDVHAAGRDQAVIAGGDHMVVNIGAAGAGSSGVPGLLPRDAPAFTGRDEELARLTGLAGGGRAVVTAIGGTAGVGKTALAVHAAHQLLPQFPDGHLYADLRGYTAGQEPADPDEVLAVFLRRLGVPAEDVPTGVEERSGLLRQLLASRRVLMVLDNARTEVQVRPLLPGAGGSLVLVTSRSVLPGLEADARISLDVLALDQAAGMLARLIGTARAAAEPEAVAHLAGLCGRLPLALRIAGQLLAAHLAWPVDRLVQMLAGEQDRLKELSAGDLQVRAAFEVSYRQLAEGDARLFRLLGLHPGPDFDTAAAAALAGIETEAAWPVLRRLAEAGLVIEDSTGRTGLHDLLRLFARGTCQDADSQADRDAAEARLVCHYVDLAKFLDSCVDPQLRPAAAQRAEHAAMPLPSIREALGVFQAGRRSLLAALSLAAGQNWDEQVLRLSEAMGDSLTLLHYLDDLLTCREAGLAAARRAGDTPAEARALGALGGAYQEMQRFEEAITCHQNCLTIFRETGNRRFEGMALNNIGICCHVMQRFEEAITYFQESLTIKREVGDRHGEGMTLTNLGNTYMRLQRFEEAITCHQESLTITREVGDRHGEGMTLTNLGNTYVQLQRFEEAIACYQQDIAVCRETGDRHGEGQTLSNLGDTYAEMRQPERAAMCWREAAAAMRDTGDHEEAERLDQLAANTQSRPRRRWRGRRSTAE